MDTAVNHAHGPPATNGAHAPHGSHAGHGAHAAPPPADDLVPPDAVGRIAVLHVEDSPLDGDLAAARL
ncbi:MAG: hypothetical protein AVDCRST_MAG64-4090, partial [uncultured Phycisphaerae bacterium]